MLGATVVILPLKEQIRFGPFKEYLGSSKVSGGVYDALAFNKALLLPAFYRTDDLQGQFTIYHYSSSHDATQKLIYLLDQPSDARQYERKVSGVRKQMYDTLRSIVA